MLDFRIETFIAVCEHMNFTKAAQALNITQPAVSQHIHYLEQYFNTKLFEYHGKKLIITPSGEFLRTYALTLSHDSIYLKEKIASIETNKKTLRFGATLTIGQFAIYDFLCEYLFQNYEGNIHIEIDDTKTLREKITSGEIDFALVEGYFPKSEYDFLIYSEEEFVPVCSGSLNTKKKAINIDNLLENRLIIREEGSGSREIFEIYLKSKNLKVEDFNSIAEVNNINVIKRLVEKNCGITFIYKQAVLEELKKGTLKIIPVEGFPIKHNFYFIWRKGSIFADYYKDMFEKFKKARENTLL